MQEILKRAKQIRLVIFDVDGVLTDGSLFLGDDGQEYKAFNSRDGLGMKLLQKSGLEIGIITGRTSNVVALRMESLGIRHVYQGQEDKVPAFRELRDKLGLTNEQIAYVGDDVVDLPVMRQVGLAMTVRDAHPLVRQYAHWQAQAGAGRGAVREICELLMEAQGTLEQAFGKYLD
ncbi:3-deoxy-manno-octulosonate-8-phosphatase KdsC [Sedimenticola thiotaurini]|uniref:3-deoxy-D-manno-octulosonate 8-phosphate phosphatase KdsC n=1 Tax=Sedimenticola thiotaurini TaxID=1543721 RepID=A0A0F7JZA2_9GAMM|nr:3-deoxy-manno-octulosonate-8-phosphatase KdsC [Sedimenticola thiotaurini]AKH20609.1 3-deoxy-D-manno-octulosonate 8-phosphate phosphatase [Sedimenticola thiotaurini]